MTITFVRHRVSDYEAWRRVYDGIGQLQSYLAASPNARFGLWTNGDDRVCFARREKGGRIYCEEIPDISVSILGIRGQRGYAIVPIRVH